MAYRLQCEKKARIAQAKRRGRRISKGNGYGRIISITNEGGREVRYHATLGFRRLRA